jgi:disulfide bond formation protein DsbB
MAGKYGTQGLSSFSWRREAEMSAARQRLLGRTDVLPVRSEERRSAWRILGWSIVLAVLAAAILCAIAFKLGWLDITGPAFRSAGAISLRA